jgi:hypothetical protein
MFTGLTAHGQPLTSSQSHFSAIVEDSLGTIARKYVTTRFVKLHHEIAEMNHIDAPALLGYRGGDVFTTIVDIPKHLPRGRDCSAESLEDLLKEYAFLFLCPAPRNDPLSCLQEKTDQHLIRC